jgi:hypothetical protein
MFRVIFHFASGMIQNIFGTCIASKAYPSCKTIVPLNMMAYFQWYTLDQTQYLSELS